MKRETIDHHKALMLDRLREKFQVWQETTNKDSLLVDKIHQWFVAYDRQCKEMENNNLIELSKLEELETQLSKTEQISLLVGAGADIRGMDYPDCFEEKPTYDQLCKKCEELESEIEALKNAGEL